jgi:hypothetical protein
MVVSRHRREGTRNRSAGFERITRTEIEQAALSLDRPHHVRIVADSSHLCGAVEKRQRAVQLPCARVKSARLPDEGLSDESCCLSRHVVLLKRGPHTL